MGTSRSARQQAPSEAAKAKKPTVKATPATVAQETHPAGKPSAKQSAGKARTKATETPAPQTTGPERRSGAQRTLTIPVPSMDQVAAGAVNVAMLPVALARQVLPRKGLPVYLGLGALGAADVLEWPVALGLGVGYAVLRRGAGHVPAGPQPSGADGAD